MSTSSESQVEDTETTIADLETQVQTLRMDLQGLHDFAKTLREENTTLQEKVNDQQETIQELQDELSRLEDRTNLLQHVKKASALESEEKIAIILQTLVEEAEQKRKNGKTASAAMDAPQAVKTLGGGVDRTTMYDLLPRAAELVGKQEEKVCYYLREDRASQKNSRLVVNLENGEMPAMVEGYDISTGGG